MKLHRISTRVLGYSLVELLIAISIFAILLTGIVSLAIFYFQNYSFSYEENQSLGIAQTGMTRIIREIREARMGEDGAWPIVDAQDTSFAFYADVDNDGKTEKVRYAVNNQQLLRGVTAAQGTPISYPAAQEKVTVVASYVDNADTPLFRYYNGNWPADIVNNPLPVSDRIMNTRFVKVYLRINVKQGSGSQPYELTSGVSIRSLKDNL